MFVLPYRTCCLVALATCSVLLLAGCAMQRVKMYPGSDLPPSETATISGHFDRGGLMVTVESVDGQKVPGQGPVRGGGYSRDTVSVVAPGTHTVEIQFWALLWSGGTVQTHEPIPLRFEAKAGHDYEIRAARDSEDRDTAWSALATATIGGREKWVSWVVDLQTNEVVPPVGGPEDPSERRDVGASPQVGEMNRAANTEAK